MSYEPTNWKTGDVVTSAKLNKLENAVASGKMFVVHKADNTLDKTWQEIYDALLQNDFAVLYMKEDGDNYYSQEISLIVSVNNNGERCAVSVFNFNDIEIDTFECDSPSGYPTTSIGPGPVIDPGTVG